MNDLKERYEYQQTDIGEVVADNIENMVNKINNSLDIHVKSKKVYILKNPKTGKESYFEI